MTIEKPQPPKTTSEVDRLRQEVKKLQGDIDFLKQLLQHVQEEFARLKKERGR